MKFLTLFLLPYIVVFLATRHRWRGFRCAGYLSALFIQVSSLFPLVAVAYGVYIEKQETAVSNSVRLAGLYDNYSITQGQLHGLAGWEGVDIKAGCGKPIYAPFDGFVTYRGFDGYNHVDERGVVWDQATMLTIQGKDGLELTLLHGDYLVQIGDDVKQGLVIGNEASYGWSTGCHSHVILKQHGQTLNYLTWKPQAMVASAKRPSGGTDEYQHKTNDVVEGVLSGYDKLPTDQTIVNRQRWGQIPSDLTPYDAYIAVLDCNRIGQSGTLITQAGNMYVLIYDCAGIVDGGANWMIENGYVAELDYYTRQRYPGLMGTFAILEFNE